MILLKRFTPLLVLTFLILGPSAVFGQADTKALAGPNYDAVLHVVVGNSETGQAEGLPQSLSSVAKQLRSDFGVTNLKLLNTYLGRITDNGSLQYKGVSSAYTAAPDNDTPTFLDWTLGSLKSLNNAAGQNVFQFQSFRFGARVPVKTGGPRDDTGRNPMIVNYEQIGLTLDRLTIVENSPTLVGTLSQPRTNGTLFLVLTIKSAAR